MDLVPRPQDPVRRARSTPQTRALPPQHSWETLLAVRDQERSGTVIRSLQYELHRPLPMDNLTHTAIGLFLSRAGLNRWTPRATAILLLASNAPDIDTVSLAGGSLSYLHYHRHLTHALIAIPFMAVASVALVRFAGTKPIRWPGAIAAAAIAVAIHLLLDYTNMYGIRLFLPFSAEWLRLDTTSVVDLWIWAVIVVGIAAPFLGRLVGAEVSSGSLRPRHHGRRAAIFVLIFILLYGAGRAVLHARAAAMLDARIYQGGQPLRVAALPNPANPLRWRGLIETREFYAVVDVDLLAPFDPSRATIFQKPEPNPALDAARRTPTFQKFLEFSQFPLWRVLPVPEPENGTEVQAIDMRFGSPAEPGFVADAVLNSSLKVVQAEFSFGKLQPR